jgi:hypothetical protein
MKAMGRNRVIHSDNKIKRYADGGGEENPEILRRSGYSSRF